jgi:hypothetical protein
MDLSTGHGWRNYDPQSDSALQEFYQRPLVRRQLEHAKNAERLNKVPPSWRGVIQYLHGADPTPLVSSSTRSSSTLSASPAGLNLREEIPVSQNLGLCQCGGLRGGATEPIPAAQCVYCSLIQHRRGYFSPKTPLDYILSIVPERSLTPRVPTRPSSAASQRSLRSNGSQQAAAGRPTKLKPPPARFVDVYALSERLYTNTPRTTRPARPASATGRRTPMPGPGSHSPKTPSEGPSNQTGGHSHSSRRTVHFAVGSSTNGFQKRGKEHRGWTAADSHEESTVEEAGEPVPVYPARFHRAAAVIRAAFVGYCTRQWLKIQRNAAIRIQRCYRRVLQRRAEEMAVWIIQQAGRGMLNRHRFHQYGRKKRVLLNEVEERRQMYSSFSTQAATLQTQSRQRLALALNEGQGRQLIALDSQEVLTQCYLTAVSEEQRHAYIHLCAEEQLAARSTLEMFPVILGLALQKVALQRRVEVLYASEWIDLSARLDQVRRSMELDKLQLVSEPLRRGGVAREEVDLRVQLCSGCLFLRSLLERKQTAETLESDCRQSMLTLESELRVDRIWQLRYDTFEAQLRREKETIETEEIQAWGWIQSEIHGAVELHHLAVASRRQQEQEPDQTPQHRRVESGTEVSASTQSEQVVNPSATGDDGTEFSQRHAQQHAFHEARVSLCTAETTSRRKLEDAEGNRFRTFYSAHLESRWVFVANKILKDFYPFVDRELRRIKSFGHRNSVSGADLPKRDSLTQPPSRSLSQSGKSAMNGERTSTTQQPGLGEAANPNPNPIRKRINSATAADANPAPVRYVQSDSDKDSPEEDRGHTHGPPVKHAVPPPPPSPPPARQETHQFVTAPPPAPAKQKQAPPGPVPGPVQGVAKKPNGGQQEEDDDEEDYEYEYEYEYVEDEEEEDEEDDEDSNLPEAAIRSKKPQAKGPIPIPAASKTEPPAQTPEMAALAWKATNASPDPLESRGAKVVMPRGIVGGNGHRSSLERKEEDVLVNLSPLPPQATASKSTTPKGRDAGRRSTTSTPLLGRNPLMGITELDEKAKIAEMDAFAKQQVAEAEARRMEKKQSAVQFSTQKNSKVALKDHHEPSQPAAPTHKAPSNSIAVPNSFVLKEQFNRRQVSSKWAAGVAQMIGSLPRGRCQERLKLVWEAGQKEAEQRRESAIAHYVESQLH